MGARHLPDHRLDGHADEARAQEGDRAGGHLLARGKVWADVEADGRRAQRNCLVGPGSSGLLLTLARSAIRRGPHHALGSVDVHREAMIAAARWIVAA